MAFENIERFKYKFESFVLMLKDGNHEVPSDKVSSMIIERDYDNDFFPVIEVKFALSKKWYRKLIQEKNTAKIRIKLVKYKSNHQGGKVGTHELVFNELFCFISSDDYLDKEGKRNKKLESTDGTGMDSSTSNNVYSFYLYSVKYLLSSKTLINAVLCGASVLDAVSYILTESGCPNVLLEKSPNNERYGELLIPPLTAQGALLYLQNYYGIYETGMTLFYDLDCMYIMSQSTSCNVYRKNEFKTTNLCVLNMDDDSQSTGSYKNEKNKTYEINVLANSISTSSQTPYIDLISGSKIISVNPFTSGIKQINCSIDSIGNGGKRPIVDFTENKYPSKALEYEINEMQNSITVNVSDFDFDAFTPNKSFNVTYSDTTENKKRSGKYRLTKSTIAITKTIKGTFDLKKSK